MDFLIVLWLHVLSAIILVGGGFGSAFHLIAASLQRQASCAAAAAANVLRSDALFTGPSAVFQVASGLWLADRADLALSTDWLRWSLMLYGAGIALWVPVIWLEFRMRRVAREAADRRTSLPRPYWVSLAVWGLLGAVGFCAFLAVLWLMTAKRAPW